MSDDAAKLALRNAVLEWQRKYRIPDEDPMLASLELLEIYFSHRYENGPIKQPPTYGELRLTLEDAQRLTKRLSKHAGEMTEELRAVPKLREELAHGRTTAILTVALVALVVGILIGKFLL
jgi:hypothetical protein